MVGLLLLSFVLTLVVVGLATVGFWFAWRHQSWTGVLRHLALIVGYFLTAIVIAILDPGDIIVISVQTLYIIVALVVWSQLCGATGKATRAKNKALIMGSMALVITLLAT